MVIVSFFILPISYLLCALFFLILRRGTLASKASGYSLAAFFISMSFGTILILSSRGSTTAIGFLFLPTYSLIPAILSASIPFIRPTWGRGFVVVMTLSFYVLIIHQTYTNKKKNEDFDIETNRQSVEINKNSQWVKDLEVQQTDKASQLLGERANQTSDRTILIPIAESKMASIELLKQLSKNSDLGVVLTVVRNPNTPSETLEDIYFNSSYPGYFFSDLSSNSNTPERVLLQLFDKRNENSGIEKGLASNVNVPDQLIPKMLKSENALVLGELAKNRKMNCKVIVEAHSKLDTLKPETQYLSTGKAWAQPAFDRCIQDK